MAGQKTDDRDIFLGERMTEQRKRARLTQRRVAQGFGMSAAQLQKYEKGINRISAIHLEILSRMTGVPIAEFFAGIPHHDDVPNHEFAEPEQDQYSANSPWTGLALILAQHVSENFNDDCRRDFVAAINTLSRELER